MPSSVGHFIIAIDGPAGSGKSTVSKLIAEKLGLLYIDTGAMYRALTLKAMARKIDLEDRDALTKLARDTKIDLLDVSGGLKVFLDGEDVSGLIRTPELTNNVKFIARVPGVRQEMVNLQRVIGGRSSAVLEGRDIGTVVFPEARFKFYLDADVEERSKRRHKELLASDQKANLSDIKNDVVRRDESDMKRDVGALRKAPDAVFVDTTDLSIEDVVEKLLSCINKGSK
jgi:CMP/dCMP kinase